MGKLSVFSFSLSSYFSSRKLVCLWSALQPDHVPNCTTASLKNTCEGCAFILSQTCIILKKCHYFLGCFSVQFQFGFLQIVFVWFVYYSGKQKPLMKTGVRKSCED